MRRLLVLLAVVRADDDYRADGPMTVPYDPVTGEPISTVRPGWSCSNPCPTEFTNYYGPCCLNSAGEARWNLDNYCEDSLKFHTYFDSDMKFNYECEAAVDRYGCGPPVDDLSGWMSHAASKTLCDVARSRRWRRGCARERDRCRAGLEGRRASGRE